VSTLNFSDGGGPQIFRRGTPNLFFQQGGLFKTEVAGQGSPKFSMGVQFFPASEAAIIET